MAENPTAKHRITQNSKYFAFIKNVEQDHFFHVENTEDLDIAMGSEVLERPKSLLTENWYMSTF